VRRSPVESSCTARLRGGILAALAGLFLAASACASRGSAEGALSGEIQTMKPPTVNSCHPWQILIQWDAVEWWHAGVWDMRIGSCFAGETGYLRGVTLKRTRIAGNSPTPPQPNGGVTWPRDTTGRRSGRSSRRSGNLDSATGTPQFHWAS
jgi:hypothetical protein